MKVIFSDRAWREYLYWINADPNTFAPINALIEDARRNLFVGLGKPEPLAGNFSGFWSRRITREHRLVYRVEGRPDIDQSIEIASCRYHYERR